MNFLNKIKNLNGDISVLLLLDDINDSSWHSLKDVIWDIVENSDWNISVFGVNNFFVHFLLDNISDLHGSFSVFGTGNLIEDSSWFLSVLALNNSVVNGSWCFSVFSFGEVFVVLFLNVVIDGDWNISELLHLKLFVLSDWPLFDVIVCVYVIKLDCFDTSDEQ